MPSSSVPNNVSVPFRDYLGSMRFDWAPSSRSQWFLRASADNYTTDNAFVEQPALSSTGHVLPAILTNKRLTRRSDINARRVVGLGEFALAIGADQGLALTLLFIPAAIRIECFDDPISLAQIARNEPTFCASGGLFVQRGGSCAELARSQNALI